MPLEIDDDSAESLAGTAGVAGTTRPRGTTDTPVIRNRESGVSAKGAGDSAAEIPAVVT